MDICHESVAAKKQDRARPNAADGAERSPASFLAKAASESTSGDPVLFNGYYFKVLRRAQRVEPREPMSLEGGLAIIAYLRRSIGHRGDDLRRQANDVVYEKI